MSSLRRDLLDRKLWIIVAALIAAVVAAPVLLLKSASATSAPALPGPPAANTATTATTSQTSTTKQPSSAPAKVILAKIARDPFAASVPKLSATPSSSTPAGGSSTASSSTGTTPSSGSSTVAMVSPTPATSTGSGSSSSGANATSPATGPTPTSTIASTPPNTQTTNPVQSWTIYSVSIRFSRNGHGPLHNNIPRLTALPSAGNPQVMFFGVMSGGRQAVFGLSAGVAHAGHGLCRPSRTSCSAIVLAPGDSEEVGWPTATGGVAEAMLQVVKITSTVTHSRAAALKAYKHVSTSGMCDLSLASPVQYDPDTGTVQNFPKHACSGQAASAPFAFLKTMP
jgi:hypothetical protein